MLTKLLTTTAVLVALAGTANAQSATPAPADGSNAAAPSAMAPATTAAPNAASPTAAANGMDMSTLKPADMTAIKADDLKGADVLDPNGQKIASINDLVLTTDAKIDAVIVDFGGFLGIGTKQIALGFDDLKFMDDANGKHLLVVNVTKEQLDGQKAYNKDDYVANRDSERLMVSAPSTTAMAAPAAATDAMATPATDSTAAAAPAKTMASAPTTPGMAAPVATGGMTAVADPNGFATKAAPANMFEIESSKLALTKSQNADIKAFAQKMIDDHSKAGDDMKTAAETEKVTPPAALDSADQSTLDDLGKLSGADFDKAYVTAQVKAHADAVALFQDYSTNGPAGALKDFAAKTLPTLQMHNDMVKKLPQ